MYKPGIMIDKEQVIITGIINGDEQVLTHFYKNNIPYIRNYILSRHGNLEDVEDIFQDGMVVLYQKLKSGELEINVSVRTYFYSVCKNIWRNRLRRKDLYALNAQYRVKIQTNNFEAMSIEEEKEQEQEHLYRKHFQRLSPDNKKILQLFFEGRSMKEIARITGYTIGGTRKKKFYAKKKLLEMIERDPAYNELRALC